MADGFSFGTCLPTYSGGRNDQESVWGIALDVLGDIQLLQDVLGPYGQDAQFAWSTPPWFRKRVKILLPHNTYKGTIPSS